MKTFGPKNANQILQVDASSEVVTVDGAVYAQGTVADGDASVDNPLVVGGVYKSDPTSSTLTDGDVGELLINSLRMLIQENRVYDAPSDADRTIPVFIPQDRYSFEDLSGSQDDSDATISYYVSMENSSFYSIQYIPSGDGYANLTVHGSNEDVADITTSTFTPITNDHFGSVSFNTESWLEKDTTTTMKSMRIDVETFGLGPGDTSSWLLYFGKKSA